MRKLILMWCLSEYDIHSVRVSIHHQIFNIYVHVYEITQFLTPAVYQSICMYNCTSTTVPCITSEILVTPKNVHD